MQKIFLVVLSMGLILMLAFVGCDDDDSTSPVSVTVPLGHATGGLLLSSGATIMPQLEIKGNGAVAPDLDSVKVGDSLVSRSTWGLMSVSPYVDAHWIIFYDETGAPSTYMYRHGDTATVSVWGQGRSSTCDVKILDPSLANITEIDPLVRADTIAVGEADTVYWNTVEHADYYAIMMAWRIQTGGSSMYTFSYSYAIDTSFVVTGDMHLDSLLEFDVVVTPFTGPDPRTGRTNWNGTLLDGVMYSFGQYGSTTIVMEPLGPILKTSTPVSSGRPEYSANDIVAEVYKKYGN